MTSHRNHDLSENADADLEECPIALDHEADLVLCGDLERIADGLPRLPSDLALRQLTDRLHHASDRWRDPARGALFAGIGAVSDARNTDSVHAEDVIEAIWQHWRKPSEATTGQLSYMLRALFDGRRRALALERLWLGCANCQSSASD